MLGEVAELRLASAKRDGEGGWYNRGSRVIAGLPYIHP